MQHAFASPSPPLTAAGARAPLHARICSVRARRAPSMCVAGAGVRSADAVEFFKHREGRWRSRRVTHHLAFRRSESGESEISMEVLPPGDERIKDLCEQHEVDPSEATGGCYVTWKATMAWDQEGENHEGSTVFALVPDADSPRRGRMLRDRGYAEIVQIAGRYELTDDDELALTTPYEGGEVKETFAFDGADVCNRVSSVRRFGGIATATFSTESRIKAEVEEPPVTAAELQKIYADALLFGTTNSGPDEQKPLESSFLSGTRKRFADLAAARKAAAPPANSAFSSGFSNDRPSVNSAFNSGFGGEQAAPPAPAAAPDAATPTPTRQEALDGVNEAAQKAGIDLSKVPPSMREEFVRSLQLDSASGSGGEER